MVQCFKNVFFLQKNSLFCHKLKFRQTIRILETRKYTRAFFLILHPVKMITLLLSHVPTCYVTLVLYETSSHPLRVSNTRFSVVLYLSRHSEYPSQSGTLKLLENLWVRWSYASFSIATSQPDILLFVPLLFGLPYVYLSLSSVTSGSLTPALKWTPQRVPDTRHQPMSMVSMLQYTPDFYVHG